MNASRLRELTDLLLNREQQFKIQTILNELNSNLSNLAGNPQDPGTQTNFANALTKLQTAMAGMMSSFQPPQVRLLEELGAHRFFTNNLSAEISAWVQENPISPAVTQQKVGGLVNARSAFLDDITQIRDRLKKLNIEAVTLAEGTAEVGVLLPRELFHNRLDELVKELTVLNFIFRAFSEIATGSAQPAEIRQISTTDPQFFFGIDPATTAMVGGVVAWALSQWKKVEEIRKIRSETKKNQAFTDEEIKSFFDSKIDGAIKGAIEEKVTDLIGPPQKGPGRGNEKRTELAWALESILARIERGMTVEIRFVPPPAKQGETQDDTQQAAITKSFAAIAEAAPQLVFPAPDKAPILEIPPPEPEKTTRPKEAKA